MAKMLGKDMVKLEILFDKDSMSKYFFPISVPITTQSYKENQIFFNGKINYLIKNNQRVTIALNLINSQIY
jgi:hypothetical protein